jgi:orotate phosphoribosyltransferase-like protein
MSKMSELAYDIEQLYIEGLNVGQIARELNCPKEVVQDWLADQSLREFEDLDRTTPSTPKEKHEQE